MYLGFKLPTLNKWIKSNQIKANQSKPKSNQIKSHQIKPNQIKSRAINKLSVPDKIMKEGNKYNNESLVKTFNEHISFFAKRTSVKRHYN